MEESGVSQHIHNLWAADFYFLLISLQRYLNIHRNPVQVFDKKFFSPHSFSSVGGKIGTAVLSEVSFSFLVFFFF